MDPVTDRVKRCIKGDDYLTYHGRHPRLDEEQATPMLKELIGLVR